MLLLALVGATAEDIAADYDLSFEGLRARYAARGEEDQGRMLRSYLDGRGTTAHDVIVDLLRSLDIEARLRAGGLTDEHVAAVRARLLGANENSYLTVSDPYIPAL